MTRKAGSIRALGVAVTCLGLGIAQPGHALLLDFPGPAQETGGRAEALTSYRLPVGPWQAGAIPTTVAEGALDQTGWRVDTAGLTTLQLLLPLRAQLVEDGFEILFECETADCGGFDFRYGTDILPEPEMHVDLGDFRYLAARRSGAEGPEYLSLLVSRSSDQGFVQLTRIGGQDAVEPRLALSTANTPSPNTLPPDTTTLSLPAPGRDGVPGAGQIGALLESAGAVALDDLVFASGASDLVPGDYATLAGLGAWLKSDPARKIALVGHTDASGGLEGNMALSRKRAEAVRAALLSAGVAADQVIAQGVGYLSPRDTNLTEQGRERNRRVEAMLIAAAP